MKKIHSFYRDYESLHVPVTGQCDGGACLCGHHFPYVKVSCSYRWQALEDAKKNYRHIYDRHPNQNHHLEKSGRAAFRADSKGLEGILRQRAEFYVTKKVTKSNPTGRVKYRSYDTENFTNGQAPYANQVHHVLPWQQLHNEIQEIAKTAPTLKETICKALLEEKYNVNHKINAIILPCGPKHASWIGLPRHPDGGHDDYSEKIAEGIKDALACYQPVAEAMCNVEEQTNEIKPDLESISNEWHAKIIQFGESIRDNMSRKLPRGINDLMKVWV